MGHWNQRQESRARTLLPKHKIDTTTLLKDHTWVCAQLMGSLLKKACKLVEQCNYKGLFCIFKYILHLSSYRLHDFCYKNCEEDYNYEHSSILFIDYFIIAKLRYNYHLLIYVYKWRIFKYLYFGYLMIFDAHYLRSVCYTICPWRYASRHPSASSLE